MLYSRKSKILEKLGILLLAAIAISVIGLLLLRGKNIAILSPKGQIARQERSLMILAAWLSAIVIVPVFAMTIFIAWKYRASNKQAAYLPDWDHNLAIETIWWLVPLIIITILSVVTWQSTHKLSPSRSLGKDTMTIQVIALEWKWLFIYPKQQIATVNYLEIPVNTAVNFEITADAPMNSFWIPQLSGQMYAMSGMSTSLNAVANQEGTFRGVSANISGEGFSSMHFIVRSINKPDFDNWLSLVKQSPQSLNLSSYNNLARQSINNQTIYFGQYENGLYNYVVSKFNSPTKQLTANDGSQTYKYGEGI